MSEYKVDWDADEIIVAGHKCKKVEEGVYEVQDKYMVYEEEWMADPNNKNLHMIALYNGDGQLQEVKYICPELHKYVIAADKRIPKGVMHTSVFCDYTGEDEVLCNAILEQ